MSATLRVEVVAIGTELVVGDQVDTNSAWISQRLVEVGAMVVRHTSVGDGVDDMTDALRGALSRADVVIATGGLGPTQDDLTRVAVAAVADRELVRDEAMLAEIAGHFASRGRTMASTNAQQAELPSGGWWLSRVGSAPAFAIEIDRRLVVCLPGVPSEMRVIVDRDVLPLVAARGGVGTTVTRTVRTSGLGESDIAATLADLVAEVEAAGGVDVAFLASRGETRVKVTATGTDRDAVLAVIDPVVEQIVTRLGDGVVGLDGEGIEHAIGRALLADGRTLAVAESITGGGVGARLVTVPGASGWFRGGLITYATDTKAALAGVDPDVLAGPGPGPVSEEAAVGLARGAAERAGADVGLAVVGVAGPDPVGDNPVGVVWMAVAGPGGAMRTRQVRLSVRDRVDVQHLAASRALALLHEVLSGRG